MANKHLPHDLAQMQSLPLEAKIIMTQQRIRQWYEYWDGQVYVSVSGIDSTVLKHIIDQMYPDVPAVFVNTGLEYPEIQKFWKDVKDGKHSCFNPDVEIIRPKMRFDEVIKKYGYPVISKRVSNTLHYAKKNLAEGKYTYRIAALNGDIKSEDGKTSIFNCKKWSFVAEAPFDVSDHCCAIMKKHPLSDYAKRVNRKPITGQMASESQNRKAQWIIHGCNAYEKISPISSPLSFWTKQDVLHYAKKYNVPYPSVYGDIVVSSEDCINSGQTTIYDMLDDYEGAKLTTTGCDRTGCIFCMFGCHLEKEPNRFQRLKQTHPRQYEYCINGGEYITEGYAMDDSGEWKSFVFEHDDGTPMSNEEIEEFVEEFKNNADFKFARKWQPNKEGLGLGYVLDFIGVKYD